MLLFSYTLHVCLHYCIMLSSTTIQTHTWNYIFCSNNGMTWVTELSAGIFIARQIVYICILVVSFKCMFIRRCKFLSKQTNKNNNNIVYDVAAYRKRNDIKCNVMDIVIMTKWRQLQRCDVIFFFCLTHLHHYYFLNDTKCCRCKRQG